MILMQGHEGTVNTVCWDSTGEHLASVSDDLVKVWKIGSGGNAECVHELIYSGNKSHACIFHPTHPSTAIIACSEASHCSLFFSTSLVWCNIHVHLECGLSNMSNARCACLLGRPCKILPTIRLLCVGDETVVFSDVESFVLRIWSSGILLRTRKWPSVRTTNRYLAWLHQVSMVLLLPLVAITASKFGNEVIVPRFLFSFRLL